MFFLMSDWSRIPALLSVDLRIVPGPALSGSSAASARLSSMELTTQTKSTQEQERLYQVAGKEGVS